MNNVPATAPSALPSIIERAASDPTFDLDKLQRLLDMQEAHELRAAEQAWNAAHTAAEAEMETIRADANNPQTRSRYATFAQVDRAARPIYTKHGLGISFTTEPMSTPESILVVGMLSHRLGHSRRFQLPVPIVTTGFKGQAMMTPIHAMLSAVSYGKRNLEIMMFNLQVGDEDDDGNRAGGVARRPPAIMAQTERFDSDTGEVFAATATPPHVEPCMIAYLSGKENWRAWGEKLFWGIRGSTTIDDIDMWQLLNEDNLKRMKQEKPVVFDNLMTAIGGVKDKIL